MSVDEKDRDDVAGAEMEDIGFDREDMEEDAPYSHDDELFDAFGDGSHAPIITDPRDGLPRPADDFVAPAPKLSKSTLVCLEDESEWIEVFQEDARGKNVLLEMIMTPSDQARELLRNRRSRYDENGIERNPRVFKPDQVSKKFGISVVKSLKEDVVVAPKRPRCEHLVRQLTIATDIDAGGLEVRPMFTYCKAFKSVSGAFLSLMDQAVCACEMRKPRDLVTEKMIVSRIKRKIEEGEKREAVPAMKGPVLKDNPFEGEEKFDIHISLVECDPKFAPGKKSQIVCGPPSMYSGREEHVLYVGRDIATSAFKTSRGDAGVHTFLVGENDFSPPGVDPESLRIFCENWPNNASFQYLGDNLKRTPKFLADQLLRGESVYVCAKREADVPFAWMLISRALGVDISDAMRDSSGFLRPEYKSYLERTK